MTNDQLEKANKLKEEIKKLEQIIFFAKRDGFYGKLVKKAKQAIFRQEIYGGITNGTDYVLSKELEQRVTKVLEDKLTELKIDLECL